MAAELQALEAGLDWASDREAAGGHAGLRMAGSPRLLPAPDRALHTSPARLAPAVGSMSIYSRPLPLSTDAVLGLSVSPTFALGFLSPFYLFRRGRGEGTVPWVRGVAAVLVFPLPWLGADLIKREDRKSVV